MLKTDFHVVSSAWKKNIQKLSYLNFIFSNVAWKISYFDKTYYKIT